MTNSLPTPDALFTPGQVAALPPAERIAWGNMIVGYRAVEIQQEDFSVRIAGYIALALAAVFGIHVIRDILK